MCSVCFMIFGVVVIWKRFIWFGLLCNCKWCCYCWKSVCWFLRFLFLLIVCLMGCCLRCVVFFFIVNLMVLCIWRLLNVCRCLFVWCRNIWCRFCVCVIWLNYCEVCVGWLDCWVGDLVVCYIVFGYGVWDGVLVFCCLVGGWFCVCCCCVMFVRCVGLDGIVVCGRIVLVCCVMVFWCVFVDSMVCVLCVDF